MVPSRSASKEQCRIAYLLSFNWQFFRQRGSSEIWMVHKLEGSIHNHVHQQWWLMPCMWTVVLVNELHPYFLLSMPIKLAQKQKRPFHDWEECLKWRLDYRVFHDWCKPTMLKKFFYKIVILLTTRLKHNVGQLRTNTCKKMSIGDVRILRWMCDKLRKIEYQMNASGAFRGNIKRR